MAKFGFVRLARGVMLATAVAFGCLLLTGCFAARGATFAPGPVVEPKVATRTELLVDLKARMSRLATLKAKAIMNVSRQDIHVPASAKDDLRRIADKPYRKKFWRNEVNGYIRLARDPRGSRNVSFSGDISGMNFSFRLLGRDSDFWMAWPNLERERGDENMPAGYVYFGRADRTVSRPKEVWSMRPQDISDLLLFDEAFDARMICYMETWPNFYILTFLREDWPQHIYSKIWIGRSSLEPAVHQIYDGSGELVAEARFRAYRKFSASNSEVKSSLPTEITLLWPRDTLIMSMKLDGVVVNETIEDRWFKPYRTREDLPVGYVFKELKLEGMPKERMR